LHRARQIIDDDKKIYKFYILREKLIGKNYKNIKKFVKIKLVPFIKNILLLHNEREFVINKLVECTFEEWRPLCELTYDSHLKPNNPIISIEQLNNFFNLNWSIDYIKVVNELIESANKPADLSSDNLSDDDLLSDIELSDDDSDNKVKESINDYYVKNNIIKLTWKGFITYLTYIIRFMTNIAKTRVINEFNYKIHTEFVNVIKQQRNELLNLTETYKIWGYKNEDYDFI
jgi:hypothetical protein